MIDRPITTPSPHFVKTYFQSFTQDPVKKIAVVSSEPKGFIRAKMALDQKDFSKIIPACTEEIESSESEGLYKMEATLLRATFYLLTGRFVEASVDLETVITNQDASAKVKVNALIKRASLKMQTENPEGCFDDFSQAEKLDPENSDVYHHRGQVFTLLENMTEAIQDFEKAVKFAPDEGLLYVHKTYAEYRRALMSQDSNLLNEIMEQFSIAIDKFPTCVECYSLMAQVLSDQGQYQAADSFFKKSIDLDPENATLYVHRGVLQLQWQGNINTALSYIQNAIDVDDKCEFAYETLGTIEVQRANLEKAIDCFEKAINLAKSEMELVHLYSLKGMLKLKLFLPINFDVLKALN
jgi:mitochondrial import receptor subunit TOM70